MVGVFSIYENISYSAKMRSPLELSDSIFSGYSITGIGGIELSIGIAFNLFIVFKSI